MNHHFNELHETLSSLSDGGDYQRFSVLVADEGNADAVEEWVKNSKKSLDNEQIIQSIICCSELGGDAVRDTSTQVLGCAKLYESLVLTALHKRLYDKWWVVRCSAMYSISRHRAFQFTGEIISKYKSKFPIEREWVLISLTMMRDSDSKKFLEKCYNSSRSADLKYLAAGGLAALGDDECFAYLRSQKAMISCPESIITLDEIFSMLKEMGIGE